MLKRIIQITLVLLAIGLIIYIYIQLSGKEENWADPAEAIPSNAALLMEISDFNSLEDYYPLMKFLSGSDAPANALLMNPMADWYNYLLQIDSLRTVSTEWYDATMKSPVIFSCSEQGRSDSWLLSIGLKKSKTGSIASTLMGSWMKDSATRDFKGTEIHTAGTLYWSEINHCLVIASKGSLIEETILCGAKNNCLGDNSAFRVSRDIRSKDTPLHLYAAYDNRTWLQLDPSFIDGVAVLSGYGVFSDTTLSSLRLAQNGSGFNIAEHLPASTSILDVYSYADFTTGWQLQEDHHAGSTASKFWSQAWKDLGSKCACDLNEAMLSWRTGEWGTAVIANNDSSTAEISFFGVRDSIDVIGLMKPILSAQPAGVPGVTKVEYPQLFERNQSAGVLVESNYITQVGAYVFVASTPGDLYHVLSLRDTLSDSGNYKDALGGLKLNTGRFIYQNDYYSSPLPQVLVKCLYQSEYLAITSEYTGDSKYLVNVRLPLKQSKKQDGQHPAPEVNTAGETKSEVRQGPWTVINHTNQKKEKLYIDNSDQLCLEDTEGKILWKKPFKHEILGDVTQIDALKNGKLQMAFTTENGLYILDRNGNDLKSFPYLPKSPVTSPLHVADYDGTKKYRLLFATGDGMLMNLTSEGTITEGWKHQSENAVVKFVDHFRIGAEDYIITASITGKLGLYKRTGEVKSQTGTTLEEYDGGRCDITTGSDLSDTKISYTTKSGQPKTVKIGK